MAGDHNVDSSMSGLLDESLFTPLWFLALLLDCPLEEDLNSAHQQDR